MIMRKVVKVLRAAGPLPRSGELINFLRLDCGHEIIDVPTKKRRRCHACERGLPVVRESEMKSEIGRRK